MKGIDPDGTDKERAVDEAAWFKAHPVITEEEREKMRITAIEKGGLITVIGHKKSASEQGLDGVPGKKGIQVPLSPGYPLETR
jgi:hypothetical protein